MSDKQSSIADVCRLLSAEISTQQAYEYGRDCALNGPNQVNCHFGIFSCKHNTEAWERGNRDGDELKMRINRSNKK